MGKVSALDFVLDFSRKTFLMLWSIKVAATDMRYFARSKFSRSLVHKKNISLICQVVFKLGYLFCQKS